jgi:hypothetical protein
MRTRRCDRNAHTQLNTHAAHARRPVWPRPYVPAVFGSACRKRCRRSRCGCRLLLRPTGAGGPVVGLGGWPRLRGRRRGRVGWFGPLSSGHGHCWRFAVQSIDGFKKLTDPCRHYIAAQVRCSALCSIAKAQAATLSSQSSGLLCQSAASDRGMALARPCAAHSAGPAVADAIRSASQPRSARSSLAHACRVRSCRLQSCRRPNSRAHSCCSPTYS